MFAFFFNKKEEKVAVKTKLNQISNEI